MKLGVIIILVSTATVYAQSSKRVPFQILSTENAFKNNRKALRDFEFLHARDRITLKEGYIYLIHSTGMPVHFTGDTTISVKDLNASITDYIRPINDSRPNLTLLFSDSSRTPSMINDYYPFFEYPPPYTKMISQNINDDLCLEWGKKTAGKVKIALENIFDDSLKTYESDTGEVSIPSSDLRKIFTTDRILLIQPSGGSAIVCTLFQNQQIHGLFQCQLTSADRALMVGYYMERGRLFDRAEIYYRLATNLSADVVFREALDHFLIRRR